MVRFRATPSLKYPSSASDHKLDIPDAVVLLGAGAEPFLLVHLAQPHRFLIVCNNQMFVEIDLNRHICRCTCAYFNVLSMLRKISFIIITRLNAFNSIFAILAIPTRAHNFDISDLMYDQI